MRRILFFLLLLLACSASKLDDETVALVNGEPILKNELVYSINFFPQYAPTKKGEALVRNHLDLLIEKKLFAQEGRRLGFHETEHVKRVVNWVKRDEMLKALYAREVRDRVKISDEEIKQAFLRGLESIRVRHIFVKTEEEAKRVKEALDAGVPFEEIAAQTFRDSTLRANGGDLGFLTYDEMDEDFARAAFALDDGEISEPVRTKWGYHIIRVDDRRRMIFADKSELDRMRNRIERNLRRKKERQLAGRFVGDYMESLDVKMMKNAFNLMAAQLQRIVIGATELLPDYRPMFGGKEMDLLSRGLEPYMDEVLITFKGGQWTIGDFMARLKALPMNKRPRLDTPDQLRHDIGVMLRDEFLAQEAKRRGLDRDEQVLREVRKWRDEYTFSEFWQAVRDTIRVSEAEVEAYYAKHRGRYLMPEKVHIREILVATRAKAEAIRSRLDAGEDFAELAREHSLRTWAAKKGGDLGWISRGQYGNLSLRGFELGDGEIAGPLQVREGFSIIQRLGYQAIRPMNFDEARPRAEEDARSQKQQRIYDEMKAQLLARARILKNEELIREIAEQMAAGERIQMPLVREVR